MASMACLEGVDKSSTPLCGSSAEFYDKAPTHFSTIMAIVVVLEVVNLFFDHNGYRGRFGGRR